MQRQATYMICAIVISMVAGIRGTATANLIVDSTGNVGIGTATPTQALHVKGGRFLVERASGGELVKLLTTANAVRAQFTCSNSDWVIGSNANTKFRIRESSVTPIAFELDSSGNLLIAGTLTENSSRGTKEGIVPVDDREVLAKVVGLPVYKWRYRTDATRTERLGPMAEDFHEVFGIGDREHIALGTVGGISIAAIRGLNQALEERTMHLQSIVEAKDAELAALSRRLDVLETRVQAVR